VKVRVVPSSRSVTHAPAAISGDLCSL
jgi:hypothetical protein